MVQTTDYHQWDYPVENEEDWHTIVNPLIENDLDEAVILKDTLANRPAAESAGRRWWRPDECRYRY